MDKLTKSHIDAIQLVRVLIDDNDYVQASWILGRTCSYMDLFGHSKYGECVRCMHKIYDNIIHYLVPLDKHDTECNMAPGLRDKDVAHGYLNIILNELRVMDI